MDVTDGALFSRISFKQGDGDDSEKVTTGIKNVEPADTRINPIKSEVEQEGQGHAIGRALASDEEIPTCTPADLDDSDLDDDAKSQDINEPLLAEKMPKKGKNEPTDTGSIVSDDDESDALPFSRVSLSQPEIHPESSSTFYTAPLENYTETGDNSNNERPRFYEPDYETDLGVRLIDVSDNGSGEGNQRGDGLQSQANDNEEIELRNLNGGDGRGVNPEAGGPPHDTAIAKPKKQKSLHWRLFKGLVFPIISLGIYLWDIGSDIYLACSYKESGNMDLFWITLSCIIIPHLLMMIVDMSWVYLDQKRGAKNIYRYILGGLTCGRIVRALTYMWHVYNHKMLKHASSADTTDNAEGPQPKKPHKWHRDRAIEEKRDCFMLDFINAFAESAPQLFVQLYLYYAYNLDLTVLRVLNLLSSWISIGWTYAAYYRCNREALKGEQDVKIVAFGFFFFSVLSALAARFISTTLFLAHFQIWIGLTILGCHFLGMLLWISCIEKPELPGTANSLWGRSLYYIFFAFVCIMCFMNLSDSRAKIRMTVFYAVIYVENMIMAALAFWKMDETGSDKMAHLLILPLGFIIHIVLLVNFYKFLHPKTGLCYNCQVKERAV